MNTAIPTKVIVTASGQFAPGLAVCLRFKMNIKNDYYYTVFLNSNGKAEVLKDELLHEFNRVANFSIMDYVNPEAAFTGAIEARILTDDDLNGAMQAYDKFKAQWQYPTQYLEQVSNAISASSKSNCTVSVEQIAA
jgi:hypothetical protein